MKRLTDYYRDVMTLPHETRVTLDDWLGATLRGKHYRNAEAGRAIVNDALVGFMVVDLPAHPDADSILLWVASTAQVQRDLVANCAARD